MPTAPSTPIALARSSIWTLAHGCPGAESLTRVAENQVKLPHGGEGGGQET